MIRQSDSDIEYRIIEVEKSASLDEEKVKQELYDALLDKKKVIEDLRGQLAFRNSTLEHELLQRQSLENVRRNLVLRLKEALDSSTEEPQTGPPTRLSVGVQTCPLRGRTRSSHVQTWEPPQAIHHHHLAEEVMELQDQLQEMRKQQTIIEKNYEKRLTDLRLQHIRTSDSLSKTHFSQEQLLGNTVLQLQDENIELRKQVEMMKPQAVLISSDSDDFTQSGFCCAPRRVRRKKKERGPGRRRPPYSSAFWSNGTET